METLYSVLIAPVDLKNDQIALTVITHAEKKGMSVLRDAASKEEFEKTIAARIKNSQERRFNGVVPLACSDVRSLIAEADANQRSKGDRLYCVLDTDMEDLPHHADVFATSPHPYDPKNSKEAWRKQRPRLMELMLRDFLSPEQFRGGAHASHAHSARDGTS
ncbi:MAG: hypothetical protein ACREDM_05760 [Methylocella sp.]